MQVAMLGALEVGQAPTGASNAIQALAYPLREPLAARLMRALHACGRRGAVLEIYEQARKRLAGQVP